MYLPKYSSQLTLNQQIPKIGLTRMDNLLIYAPIMLYLLNLAPSEEWTYTETCGQKIVVFWLSGLFLPFILFQIDFGTESKYELYQRFSIQANMLVNHISGSGGDNRPIWPIIQLLIKYTTYDQPCRFCKSVPFLYTLQV